MPVRKAVIPSAGLGTRFLPASKAISKVMMPVVDKPLVQYAVEEAVRAGIETICIVVSPGVVSIAEHFDPSPELEALLDEKGQTDLLEQITAVTALADVEFVVQERAMGLGHAVACAKDFVGKDAFAVLLPDEIYDPKGNFLGEMIEVFDKNTASVIAVTEVESYEIALYGSIEFETTPTAGLLEVHSVIEKPDPKEAPSNLAVIGRYVLAAEVIRLLQEVPAGAGGEIQLTDGLSGLAERGKLLAQVYKGRRWDAGRKDTYLEAIVSLAAEREDLGPGFLKFLRSFRPV